MQDVCLGPEYGGQGKITARWTHPVTLSVVEGSSAQLPDLRDVVAQLNSALATTTMRVQLSRDGDTAADIQVHLAPLSRFDSIAASHGFSVAPGNWGYAYAFWDGQHQITKAFVLLAADKLKGSQLRHFTHEEITHALGPLNDSKVFTDSVLFQVRNDSGSASRLSDNDRRLLEFLYAHVPPGTDKAGLDAAFDAHWR